MDQHPGTRGEIRDFLASRRAKITPAQAGLPTSTAAGSPGCGARKSPFSPA
nr:hypothetical protein [Actinospica robiniae]